MAARRVGVSHPTGRRWLTAWNESGVDGLRANFADGPPAKLAVDQREEFFVLLKEGQPWTPQEIDALLWDCYGITYDRAHLAWDSPRGRDAIREITADGSPITGGH